MITAMLHTLTSLADIMTGASAAHGKARKFSDLAKTNWTGAR
jgi:hypothetical protein